MALDLKELERKLDECLQKETPESLREWLNKKRIEEAEADMLSGQFSSFSDELKNPQSCLNKAADDEMIFVLRGKDITSPRTILDWIKTNITYSNLPDEKLREAFECALAMRKIPDKKLPD